MPLDAFFGLLGGLIVLAFVANILYQRTRVSDLVVLIVIGVLLGPVLHWVDVDKFRPVTHAFGTLALIVILFEGGLELKLRDAIRHFPGALVLAILGYVLTVSPVALVAHFGLQLALIPSLLVARWWAACILHADMEARTFLTTEVQVFCPVWVRKC